ncbi:MAG: hypothetical protein KA393_03630 [Limnohabitans sp.]|nr:hypothetical protein [Limnohabitans sp.]
MKLSKIREDYYYFSGKASEVTRQLSLAGIAVIWIFKSEAQNQLAIPKQVLEPLTLFIGSLAVDLMQYVIASLVWGAFARFHEKRGVKDSGEVIAPNYFNYPAIVFFWTKIALAIAGYILLLLFLQQKVTAV